MKLLSVDEFKKHTARWGMRPIDDRFGFSTDDLESPWWWPNGEPDGALVRPWELARLIVDSLESAVLAQPTGFFVLPPGGNWIWFDVESHPTPGTLLWHEHESYRVSRAIIESVGIPRGFVGAAYFEHGELDRLAAVVFARCFMIDNCIGDATDDTWVYPAHGRLYLHFDDEEITWGMAADSEPLKQFDDDIIRRGWGWLREPNSNEVTT